MFAGANAEILNKKSMCNNKEWMGDYCFACTYALVWKTAEPDHDNTCVRKQQNRPFEVKKKEINRREKQDICVERRDKIDERGG